MSDIITYPENGITYDADDASGYLATRQSGVYSAEEDFAVSISGELSLTVSAGQAWVRPSRFKGRSIIMEQPTTLALTAADPVRTRIDRVVLRYDAAARKTSLQVLEGTPDSASPTAPAITRTALVYDLCLAEITRPAGSTAITAANLTDTRADETVCGVMRDGVTGIPTAQLIAQWQAAQAAQEADARQQTENQLTAAQQKFDAQMSTMQQQSGELSAEIKKLQDGGFYTKEEADAKFGKLYTLPAATSTALGGVKLSEDFTADEDGTLHLAGGTALGPYPVGSIYQSTDAASPAALFGGTWEQIASNRVLMGTTDSSKAGFTVEAGLPNIVFNLNDNYFGESPTGTGGVSVSVRGSTYLRSGGNMPAAYGNVSFDASGSSSIYGNSRTVQPPAYYVYIWRRVA
jgi:hypothetical protein